MRSKAWYALVVVFLSTVCPALAAEHVAPSRPTARQVIERIKKNIGVPWSDQTVDTFKAGDPDTSVPGVATTFLATYDVLQRAAASGKNLVITHEPTFYGSTKGSRTEAEDGETGVI